MELQEIGLSRSGAGALVRDHSELLSFTASGELLGIEVVAPVAALANAPDVRDEVRNILVKTSSAGRD